MIVCCRVALSTADSNKWLLLKEAHLERQTPEVITSTDYRLLGPIRQRQRRLTGAQVAEMATKYEAGATVYQLAAEFGCHRTTVAERLKKSGIVMRGQSPAPEVIDSMARLYTRGLSFPFRWSANNWGSVQTPLGIACENVRRT